jgi:hypothetical protein
MLKSCRQMLKRRMNMKMSMLVAVAAPGLIGILGCDLTTDDGISLSTGTIDDPLVLDANSSTDVTFGAFIGKEKLYIKIINITPPIDTHTVNLTGLNDNVDLYTYSDAFTTQEGFSINSGTTDETADGTTTAAGELYIMLDGTKTTSGSNYTFKAYT